MHCPNCGATEQGRVRVCQACGTTYASEDLLELRQLEFLLQETSGWPEADARRLPYGDRLAALKARIVPAAEVRSSAPVAQPISALNAAPVVPVATPEQLPARAEPKPEPIPFDQWLLSERTLKAALYSGGGLLILAGLIFVGVNWGRIPGPAKFMVTLLATGLMYLGGYLLFQRPGLRLGAVAVLGVASGFLPLNFVVLQLYIFSAHGLSPNAMWLIGSIPTLLLYALTAYWTRADFFAYLGLGAVISVVTAGLVLRGAPSLGFGLAYSLLALAFLLAGRALQSTRLAGFTRTPLLIVANVAAALLLIANAYEWVSATICRYCQSGSPWLALLGLLVGVMFYLTADLVFHWRLARWVAAFTFVPTFLFLLTQLGFAGQLTGIALMVLALAYLLGGYFLEVRAGQRTAAWPLYAAAYAVAAFVTLQALLAVGHDPIGLAKTAIGDVVLLAVSARVHRQYAWLYGATWLFILPVFLYAGQYVHGSANQGLVLGFLMLNYAAAGYALGRRALRLGGPFLSAAAFLSVAVVVLAWSSAVVVSIVLGLVAMLYLLWALWLGEKWTWLLLAALAATDVGAMTVLRIFLRTDSPGSISLTVTYAAIGIALALGGIALRRGGLRRWAWPLYLVAALNLAGAYLVGLVLGGTLAIALSALLALLVFYVTWFEQAALAKAKLPPMFTYLGAGLLFVGHFYLIDLSSRAWLVWPAITAGLCALFVLAAGLLDNEALARLYGTPLRRVGLALMLVPLAVAVYQFNQPALGAVTFGIASLTYMAEARKRRSWALGYAGAGALIAVAWWLFLFFKVDNLQAYTLPVGLGLLALGWNERRRGHQVNYRWPTLLGLLILMGAAFYQSLGHVAYALLLLVESLAAVGWGIRARSRGYVQVGVLAMIANALAQLGPGFVELPRWIQLGAIGGLLLGGGLGALFRREQILTARRALGAEWKSWQA